MNTITWPSVRDRRAATESLGPRHRYLLDCLRVREAEREIRQAVARDKGEDLTRPADPPIL